MERLREGILLGFAVAGFAFMARMTFELFGWLNIPGSYHSLIITALSLLFVYWAWILPRWKEKKKDKE